jgi:hypothetical protein
MPSLRNLATWRNFFVPVLAAGLLTACGNQAAVNPTGTAPAAATPGAAAPAGAPVQLVGTPPTSITAGQDYRFQPQVAQGGGVVSFKIQGQPAWADFDTDTGMLTGTPPMADVGRTGGITITGSNGSSSAAIGPFTIQVNAPAPPAPSTGSASLSWVAPTENIDGTPITALAGYHIYYGNSAGAMTTTVTVADASETSYVISGLAPGTYYFTVVAYNSMGVDSGESNTASKTI